MNSKNNKRILFAVLATSALTLCGVGAVTASFSNSYFSLGEEETYQLLMNKNKNNLVISTGPVSGTLLCKTEEDHNVSMSYCYVDKCDNGVVTLVNENSSIYNQSPIHGLKSLTFDVVEEFATFYVDWNDTGIFTSGTYESGQFFSIMSGASYTCTFENEYPDYFRIRTIGDSISITSVVITYTCK